MSILLQTPEHHWVCPNCTETHVTHNVEPHTPFHACRGLKGLTAPFVPEGLKAKVEAHEREDYVGDDEAQYDGDGKAMMSVVTTREDGEDCAVLAPTARFKMGDQ